MTYVITTDAAERPGFHFGRGRRPAGPAGAVAGYEAVATRKKAL
jgi:hypothetical protein